jgi:uncharacterized protein (DUF952 family)
LYKVILKDLWKDSQGQAFLDLPTFDRPYVHLATEEQVKKVIQKFFKDKSEILALKIDTNFLRGRLIKEINPGGTTEYYHYYDGDIPLRSIVEVIEVLEVLD